MFEQKITFDRLIRWIITALIIIAVIFVIDYLSNVLLPFFIAWLFSLISAIFMFSLFLREIKPAVYL